MPRCRRRFFGRLKVMEWKGLRRQQWRKSSEIVVEKLRANELAFEKRSKPPNAMGNGKLKMEKILTNKSGGMVVEVVTRDADIAMVRYGGPFRVKTATA